VIGRLRGVVVQRGSDGSCVVDVGGVGYEVFVPLGTLGGLPQPPEAATLHIHTHVREDALVLYGFASAVDRDMFRTMLGVSGVGPRLALAVLGTVGSRGLRVAIATGDRAGLKGIPGVGNKTAERLLLELKDRLPPLAAGEAAGVVAPLGAAPPTGPLAAVSSALVHMGFKPGEAERAVSMIHEVDGRSAEELLREALGHMG